MTPLPAIIQQDLFMLGVINKNRLLIKQTNSWQEAYSLWQELVKIEDWIPTYIVFDIGSGFFKLVVANSEEAIMTTNNQMEVFKKAYKLNYSDYSKHFAAISDSNSESLLKSLEEAPENTVDNTIGSQCGKTTSLEFLRDKLIIKSEPDRVLTSRMILEIPEALDLPIDEYEMLCQMLVMAGIKLFDSNEEFENWRKQNSKKKQSRSRAGKCFKKVFEKVVRLDNTQKNLINELNKRTRLPRNGVRFYLEKAEKEERKADMKLFNHYSGPAIRSALLFYEKNLISSLDLGDLIQESLLMLFNSIVEIRTIGKRQFQTNLSLRLYHGFNRIFCSNLPIRIPAHVFERIRGNLDAFLVSRCENVKNDQIKKLAETLELNEELVVKIFASVSIPKSVEDLQESEYDDSCAKEFLAFDMDLDRQILNDFIAKALETLKAKEREVIARRFGLKIGLAPSCKSYPETLEEIAVDFHVTRERIRQIEQKALRKLRHPTRSKKLKDFYLYC